MFINLFCYPLYPPQLTSRPHQKGLYEQKRSNPLQAETLFKEALYCHTTWVSPKHGAGRTEIVGDDLHVFSECVIY